MIKWSVCIAVLAALLSANATACTVVMQAHDLAPNSLIITEYLANPVGVSDAQAEYFELYNTTPFDIDMTGIVVRDDGSNSFTVSGLIIAARSFAVFSSTDGAALGLTPDYVYGSSMSLTNTDDEIGLFRPDDTLISKVAYTDGDFFGAGIAHELAMLNLAGPSLLLGPSIGTDFIAAVTALPLGNFGSPGFAGRTAINGPAVPVPAAVWMFGSALSILGWVRHRITRHSGAHRAGTSDAKFDWSKSVDHDGPDGINHHFGGGAVLKPRDSGIFQS